MPNYSDTEPQYFKNRIQAARTAPDISKSDLAAVAKQYEGELVLKGILKRLGAIDYVQADAASIALHNEGMYLLQLLCEASPTVACRIVADNLGIFNNKKD